MITITSEQMGQRIDNYLLVRYKRVPRARIYRAIRKGEVRVNQKRVKQTYRLQVGDVLRMPPLKSDEANKRIVKPNAALSHLLESRIVYEDDGLLILNKPAGLPVHGGSCISAGIIEMLRVMRPKQKMLELVHRLDRDTSGCLLIAKKRAVLVEWHRLLVARQVRKSYLLLVKGQFQSMHARIQAPLLKCSLRSGERIVCVSEQGRPAVTSFTPIATFKEATLLRAKPLSGRTHQIRVHAAHCGHPIAGDSKYGDTEFNRLLKSYGLGRLFLHAESIQAALLMPTEQIIRATAPLDMALDQVLGRLTPC